LPEGVGTPPNKLPGQSRRAGEYPTVKIPGSPTASPQLAAAEKQIRIALAAKGLEKSEKKFLEYSLKEIQIQANKTLTPLQKAEALLETFRTYANGLEKVHESVPRKLIELEQRVAKLRNAA
jgi:hypothetical protein